MPNSRVLALFQAPTSWPSCNSWICSARSCASAYFRFIAATCGSVAPRSADESVERKVHLEDELPHGRSFARTRSKARASLRSAPLRYGTHRGAEGRDGANVGACALAPGRGAL